DRGRVDVHPLAHHSPFRRIANCLRLRRLSPPAFRLPPPAFHLKLLRPPLALALVRSFVVAESEECRVSEQTVRRELAITDLAHMKRISPHRCFCLRDLVTL